MKYYSPLYFWASIQYQHKYEERALVTMAIHNGYEYMDILRVQMQTLVLFIIIILVRLKQKGTICLILIRTINCSLQINLSI